MIFRSISKKEWWFIGIMSIFIILFTTLPFIYGSVTTPEGAYFIGVHSLAPGDYYVYLSDIKQAYDGHFLFRDLYTTESAKYDILNTFWNFAGVIGKIFFLSPILAFHVSRIISIIVLLISLYALLAYYTNDVMKRKVMFAFLCFSTGIGAFFEPLFAKSEMIAGYYFKPMDVWVAESNIFLSMLHSGHMVMSLAILVLIFLFYLRALENKSYFYSTIAGLLMLLLLSFHPFIFPLVFGVIAAHVLFLLLTRGKKQISSLYHFLVILAFSLPMLIYYAYMLMFNVVAQGRAEQNINMTSTPLLLILSFGFLLPCAIGGIYVFLKRKAANEKIYFFIIWLIVQTVIIYLPLNFQRRMIEGLQIPLVLFAVEFLFFLYPIVRDKLRHKFFIGYIFKNSMVLFYALLVIFGSSNLFVWARDIALYAEKSSSAYISKGESDAMAWLNGLGDDARILSDVNSGYFIPGISAKTVFAGHAVETLYYNDKEKRIGKFFQDNVNDEEKIHFLKSYEITHIFYGPREKIFGDYSPQEKKYLSKEYDNGEVSIYKVKSEILNPK